MIIYGINPVAEAIRSGRVREIRVAERADERLQRVLDEAGRLGVPVRRVDRSALDVDAKGGVHQGVVADIERREDVSLEDLIGGDDGPPLIVVLDEVEDPQNVGAIVRTVDAAGGTGVVRQTRRAAALDGAAVKASAGAIHFVPIADVVNIARSLEALKKAGIWTLGLDADGNALL